MKHRQFLKTLTLTTVLVAATVLAQTPYDEGQRALREQNWTAAAEQFEKAIKADEKTADASMYWRAHALYKAGRNKQAERQVKTLERKYPDSRWVKEAQLLQIEHDSATVLVDVADESGMDEDLRMFALAQLMDRDSERALPLVLDMLKTTESESVRNDTLFMLGMSDDPRAQEAIARIARDSKNPELQASAIHMLGISDNEPSIELLADLYRESDSNDVKRAVIQAYMVGDESDELVAILGELLETEQNTELQMDIIRTLGLMDATDELRKLYPTLKDSETKSAVLEAYFLAGDTQTLRQVLETETDPELRKTAIRGIAMEDDEGAADLLESVYDNAASIEEKKAILESLVMMDDAQDLALKIVRTETDVELRKLVLESMMIAEDIDGLQKVLQSETDEELRAQAIQMLAISDDDEAAQYLVELYPNASRTEKQAVIQSMMIMDDAEGLINLMRAETDAGLKREMLQLLTIMDSEAANDYLFEMLENKG